MKGKDQCKKLNTLSLKGYGFYTTSEPCPTCLTSMIKTQVSYSYYGAKTEKVPVNYCYNLTMKLLLTSAGMDIEKEIINILPKPINNLTLGHVITASKPEPNIDYVKKDKDKINKLGSLVVEDIDIEGKDEKTLRNILINKNAVIVQGGNTFYLLKHVKKSGFDKVIKDLVNKGLIYIGISAGSYIACPTIEQSFWNHEKPNTFGVTDLTGLNLVPFLITAHFTKQVKPIIEKAVRLTKYPVVAISDQQAILVNNNKYKVVGNGEKVFYNNFKENWYTS